MLLIDTHAHIYDPQFEDQAALVERAAKQGVQQIWMPNCASETIKPMTTLAEQFPGHCRAMMGLHPCYVTETVENELMIVKSQLNQYTYVAVGEIGLDFYWDMTHINRQFEAFRIQLCWAAEKKLPVSIHSRSGHDRNAFTEAADIIDELALPGLTGIFHCFVGTIGEAERAIELGFKLGIGGVSTFKNSYLDRVLPFVGLEHLVLETDAPYLPPVPYRGKRNEPAYLQLIAQRVADLKQLPIEEVAFQTTQNAINLVP